MRLRAGAVLTAAMAVACGPGGVLGPRFVECNSTETCRAQSAERDRELARAVAKEPPARRVAVEAASERVLVDRARELVYAVDRDLVALDLATGAERWRVAIGAPPGAEVSLGRAGAFLVVAREPSALPPRVVFVDPDAPGHPSSCSLAVAAPKEAANVIVSVFDRGGQPYAFWRSWWSYHGGTPPDESAKKHEEDAEACGVVKIDPRSCTSTREPLGDFVWTPPEGRRERAGEHRFCAMLSVLRDVPAAAASAPPASTTKDVRVDAKEERVGECQSKVRVTLAVDARWSRVLDESDREICGPP